MTDEIDAAQHMMIVAHLKSHTKNANLFKPIWLWADVELLSVDRCFRRLSSSI